MAIGTPTFHAAAGIVGTSTTTGSFTPQADSQLFAMSCNYSQNTVGGEPTLTDSAGLTWNRVRNVTYDPGANRRMNTTLWVADIGSSPASMTVTVSGVSAIEVVVVLFSVTGADNDFTNIADNNQNTGDPSVTLPNTPAAGTTVIGAVLTQGGNAFTPPTGYTEIYDNIPVASRRGTVVYDAASAGQTLTWSSTNSLSTAIAVELLEATADQTITGALFTDGDMFQVGAITTENTITGALYDDPDTFYGATIGSAAQDITGALFTDGDTFQAATITAEATILGALYSDADTFHAATLTTSADIVGAVYVDPDTFHSATVQGQNTITGALVTDPDTFFAATISPGAATIQGSLYIDPDTFYNGVVTGGGSSGGSTGAIMLRRRRR